MLLTEATLLQLGVSSRLQARQIVLLPCSYTVSLPAGCSFPHLTRTAKRLARVPPESHWNGPSFWHQESCGSYLRQLKADYAFLVRLKSLDQFTGRSPRTDSNPVSHQEANKASAAFGFMPLDDLCCELASFPAD